MMVQVLGSGLIPGPWRQSALGLTAGAQGWWGEAAGHLMNEPLGEQSLSSVSISLVFE